MLTHDEDADSIRDARFFGLVPNNQIFPISEGKDDKEYVKIDGLIYLVKSEGEVIRLESVKPKNQIQVQSQEIVSQPFVRVYQEDSEGELSEVLVPKSAYFECPQSKEGVISFSSENQKYVAKQNDEGGFSITPSSKRKLDSIPFDFNSELFVLAKDPKSKIILKIYSA